LPRVETRQRLRAFDIDHRVYKGEVVARFAPDVDADDPRLVSAIDAELAKSI